MEVWELKLYFLIFTHPPEDYKKKKKKKKTLLLSPVLERGNNQVPAGLCFPSVDVRWHTRQ